MDLFIVGFPYSFGKKELAQLFEQHGEVKSAKVICDVDTGRSRCFGFVEMPDADEAKKAMEEMDGLLVEDRKITVREARPKKMARQDGC